MNARRFLTIFFMVAFCSHLNAQIARQTGVIRETVTDNEGMTIPGMTIILSGPSLMGTLTDLAGQDGSFRLSGLPPGTYTVTAELKGLYLVLFQPWSCPLEDSRQFCSCYHSRQEV